MLTSKGASLSVLNTTNAGEAAYIKGTRRQRGGSLGEDFAREVHPARHRAWSGRSLRLAGRLRRRRQQLRRRFRRWKVWWRQLRWRELRWRQLRWWRFGWLRRGLEEIVRRRCRGRRNGHRERVRGRARECTQVRGFG